MCLILDIFTPPPFNFCSDVIYGSPPALPPFSVGRTCESLRASLYAAERTGRGGSAKRQKRNIRLRVRIGILCYVLDLYYRVTHLDLTC